jgi:hypothetical protein
MAVKEIVAGQRFIALSTDQKPTSGIIAGATLRETDTFKDFIFDGEVWVPKAQKTMTLQWTNETIASQSFFAQSIPCADFDVATAFVAGTGNIQISFRVASPDGSAYAWDPLGTMNSASMRASCQAIVSGIETIKVIAANNTGEAVNANIYVYLGKR